MTQPPKRKTKAHVYGTVTFNDPLAATIFDRRATDFNTGLRDKDLIKCGSIIGNLYRKSAQDDAAATDALQELVKLIGSNQTRFHDTVASIEEAFNDLPAEKRLPSRPGSGLSFDVTWNNKMFLAVLQILQDFDAARGKLVCLKDHNAIEHKQYAKLSKQLLTPLRSIIESVFSLAKQAN